MWERHSCRDCRGRNAAPTTQVSIIAMPDITHEVLQQIHAAIEEKKQLNIIGGNSKAFYGRAPHSDPLHIAQHTGIVNYEHTELVMTARAGTTLEDIERALDANHQMLPFEPPHFGPGATIGGTVACNLSGPRRPYAGAARDYVLGVRMINGKADVLRFGGEVMKNVAGYDVARLMAGAMGTLGVLLDVSFKVLPQPSNELTLTQGAKPAEAIETMNQWAGTPIPLSATAYVDGKLYVRLSGTASAVQAAGAQIGGDVVADAGHFWRGLREHQLPFFKRANALWRLSVPQNTPPLALPGDWLIEWGGGLRWLTTDEGPGRIRDIARAAGGHATLFCGGDREREVFHPLDEHVATLHQRLKHAFDPHHVFNPGRLYAGF